MIESRRSTSANPGSARRLALARSDLPAQTLRILSRGGWANPDVLLVRCGGRPVVVKDFGVRRAWVRATVGRWLCRREQRAYRAVTGLCAVPRHLGALDAHAFALEYRPGEPLSRDVARRVPPGFLDELRDVVHAMHERCVVHLDLRHHSNILVDRDGHPVIIDFTSALCLRDWGRLGRWLLPLLGWIDRRALRKWEARVGAAGWATQRSPDAGPTPAGSGDTPSAGSRGAKRPM